MSTMLFAVTVTLINLCLVSGGLVTKSQKPTVRPDITSPAYTDPPYFTFDDDGSCGEQESIFRCFFLRGVLNIRVVICALITAFLATILLIYYKCHKKRKSYLKQNAYGRLQSSVSAVTDKQ